MEYTPRLFAHFAVSIAIGFLVGLERERKPLPKAGLRTFAIIALLGTLTALIANQTGSHWIVAATALAIAGVLAGAHFVDPRTTADDSGTTTVVAALAVYFLGVITFSGEWLLAVTLGVAITTLLHYKPELEGISKRLTAQDIRSMLQFAILTAVILPLLPNEPLGPFGVLNPFQVWLVVLLISGVSLAGYVVWRLTLASGVQALRRGVVLTGILGGVVSSTATTVVYSRHVRDGTHTTALGVAIIVLANAIMLVRVLLFSAVVAPTVLPLVALVLVPALLLALPTLLRRLPAGDAKALHGSETYRNPTNLLVALAFAAGYAVLLMLSAWVSQRLGTAALYSLGLVSGLTDVDAITLSALHLFNAQTVQGVVAATTIAAAVASNLVMKTVVAYVTGGAVMGRSTALAFLWPVLGLGAGLAMLYAFV